VSDRKEAQSKSNVSVVGSPNNGTFESGRRDPRSRGIWQEGEEPFDFNLELNDIERAELGLRTSAIADAEKSAAKTTPPPAPQSNRTPAFLVDTSEAIHVPPPPRLGSSLRHSAPPHPTPLSTSNPAASVDWDEVTPRSTSVAAALLSGPEPVGESPPISSEPHTAETPSTEPTGGRRPSPSAPCAPAPSAPARSKSAPLQSVPPAPASAAPGLGPAAPGSSLVEAPNAARRMDSEPTPNGTFSYSFSPSFSIDNAPITTRGTHKLRAEAQAARPPRAWRRWGAVVLAAFTLPFAGAALITTWLDATRYETTTANAASPALPRAETRNAPHESGTGGAAAGAAPMVGADKPVILEPSQELGVGVGRPGAVVNAAPLEGSDANPELVTTESAAKRRTRKPVSTGKSLTQTAKSSEPSYRVKIPDEEKSIELRDGAHNVPIRE
jgi:hypothetical protein